jgi:murein hydrolase activator
MRKLLLISSLLFFCSLWTSVAQSVDNLRKERERLQQEITTANKLLQDNKMEQSSTEQNINLLLGQIQGRQKIIANINNEVSNIRKRISESNSNIRKLELEMDKHKREYELLLMELYKRRGNSDVLSYLLSSDSFNQAFQRYRMLQELNSYRKNQVLVLRKTETMLLSERSNLMVLKTTLEERFKDISKENKLLADKKKEHEIYISTLKGKEKALHAEIQAKRKRDQVLEKQIVDIIASVTKDGRKVTEGKDFGKNKGLLDTPVKNGVIVSNFGEHEHPVLRGVKVKNNGIDLKISGSELVQSVFEGEVSRIVSIPGYNKAVIIRHGKYLSVYANLSDIVVKTGDIVSKNQTIGKVFTGPGDNSGTLHFEIWFENSKQNPEQWLKM